MKFFNLLKKELRELINAQMIISLVLVLVIFMLLGNIMSTTISEATREDIQISLSDRDDTEFTAALIDTLQESGADVKLYDTSSAGDDYAAVLRDNGISDIVIIPEGFTEALDSGERPGLITVSEMQSAAMLDALSGGTGSAVSLIESCISAVISERYGVTEEQLSMIDDPIVVTENTVVGSRSAAVSPDSISGRVMVQNEVLPLIVFVLIMMTSQGLMSAIANEKIDKTLETLLSAPISRTAILGAKMLAATIVALINAVFYMVAFSAFMGKAMGEITEDTSAAAGQAGMNLPAIGDMLSLEAAMQRLGISLSLTDFVLVGLQLFFTILICLSVSMILGALVNDTKQAQTMIMPLMMMAMVPYFISLFADVHDLPVAARIVVYAIPFTHTFSAMSNLMFGHDMIFFGGLVYQIIIFAVCMFFALRIFNSDKILTISLNFGSRSRFKKNRGANDE